MGHSNIRSTIEYIHVANIDLLGAHEDVCDNCGHIKISYNSCRNRYCHKCQSVAREKWIENRKADLLIIKYFHVVFTISNEIYEIVKQNEYIV